jgi:hypothetical protein
MLSIPAINLRFALPKMLCLPHPAGIHTRLFVANSRVIGAPPLRFL